MFKKENRMEIEFVNHSSFIVKHKNIKILCDPWLEGRIFNNGWDLLSKSKFSYEDFKDIQYIWFSHEHPDHFYPPNLKKIPAEYKKNITVLFQETIDGRVANYCRNNGFKKVIELKKDQWLDLSDDFKIICEYFNEGDSWIAYKADGKTILNTNDCGIRNLSEAEYIHNKVGKVDVLLTQFSYAYWAGNKDDKPYREKIAKDKLGYMKLQVDAFKPKITIPIASYVYFCHEENFYLNDSVNTAETTFRFLNENTSTEPVVLYNGDKYTIFQDWDSTNSINAYKNDFKLIEENQSILEKNQPYKIGELGILANKFILNLTDTNPKWIKFILKPTFIYLYDHNKSFELSLQGWKEKEIVSDKCDVLLSSESLAFCFKFPYGLDTTQISGRIQKPNQGEYVKFYNFFRIDQQKSRGQDLTLNYVFGAIIRKIKVKLGLMKA